MATVDVIITAYNSASTIEATLRSVRNQSVQDWRAIVVDDCSDDDTVIRAKQLGDSRISVIRAKTRTITGARNIALRHLEGSDSPFIAILDGDDKWEANYLESQLAAFSRCSLGSTQPVGIVACDAYIEIDGKTEGRTYLQGLAVRKCPSLRSMLRSNEIFVSAMLSASIVRQVGQFSEDLPGAQDYDMWLRILETGSAVCFNDLPLATYTLRPNSMSSNRLLVYRDTANALRRSFSRGQLSTSEKFLALRSVIDLRARIFSVSYLQGARPATKWGWLCGMAYVLAALLLSPFSSARWLRVALREARGLGFAANAPLPGKRS